MMNWLLKRKLKKLRGDIGFQLMSMEADLEGVENVEALYEEKWRQAKAIDIVLGLMSQ